MTSRSRAILNRFPGAALGNLEGAEERRCAVQVPKAIHSPMRAAMIYHSGEACA